MKLIEKLNVTAGGYIKNSTEPDVAKVLAFKDFIWYQLIPGICVFGIVTNFISILIFRRSELKNSVYRYMLFHSIAALVHLTVSLIHYSVFWFSSMRFLTYFGKFIEFQAFMNLSTSIGLFMILIELTIAFKRFLIVTNYNITLKIRFRTLIIIYLLVIMFAQIPSLKFLFQDFSKFVDESEKKNKHVPTAYFELLSRELSQNTFLNVSYSFISLFRGIIAPALLFLVNFVITVLFRRQMKKKSLLKKLGANRSKKH